MTDYVVTLTPVQIANAASVAFQCVGSFPIEVSRGNVFPGFEFSPGEGDRGLVSELWPAGSGNVVWARAIGANSAVRVL